MRSDHDEAKSTVTLSSVILRGSTAREAWRDRLALAYPFDRATIELMAVVKVHGPY